MWVHSRPFKTLCWEGYSIAAIAKIANGKIIAQMQEEKDRLEQEANEAKAAEDAAANINNDAEGTDNPTNDTPEATEE